MVTAEVCYNMGMLTYMRIIKEIAQVTPYMQRGIITTLIVLFVDVK